MQSKLKQINLKETQNIEKKILAEFIQFCEKKKLKYSLIGGTLLGAIRHNGFIPWDDDVDVAMPREDYDIFLKSFDSKNCHILNYNIVKKYPFPFTKLIYNSTTGKNTDLRKIDGYGVYIDVFPVDNVIDNLHYKKILKHNCKIAWFRILKYSKNDWWKYKNEVKILELILYPVNLIFGIYWRYLKNYRKEYIKLEKRYINCSESNGVKFFFDEKWPVVNLDDFRDYEIKRFEDLECRVIKSWDYWLNNFYGDYMKIPKEQDRVQHMHEFYLKEN